MAKIVFLDIESTGLDLDRHEIWEIGLIVRDQYHERALLDDGSLAPAKDTEHLFQLVPQRLELADPQALRINRFTERLWRPETHIYSAYVAANAGGTIDTSKPEFHGFYQAQLADLLFGLLDGAVIIGSNVGSFDIPMLRKFQAGQGYPWTAHYHPIDTPDLVAGYLAHHAAVPTPEPPYRSSDLYRQIGIDISGTDARHTALGDARRERDVYDAVMGS